MPEVTEKKKSPESVASAPVIPAAKKKAPGLQFRRLFTKPGVSPYDEIEWERRVAQITDAQGNVIFEQKDVEVPKDWSMTATNIVASKYLHGTIGTPERETGVVDADAEPGPALGQPGEARHVLDRRIAAVDEPERVESRESGLPALVIEVVVVAEIAYAA